jgi:hypothetical protein
MIKQMYALLDHTAQIFLNPLVFTNDGDAIRWFTTVVNNSDEKNNISKYPEQFTLFRLADYDEKTGCYLPREREPETVNLKPKQLITGVQVQEEKNKKFTVTQLITLLETELTQRGVIQISESKAYAEKLAENNGE